MKPMIQQAPDQQAAIAAAHVTLYRRIATVFVVLTVGTIALALYVVFARATVVILSRQEPVKSEFIVDVAREPAPGDVAGDVLEATDSITQTFPSTSLVKVDAHATGLVRISSSLARAQTLVATTRLLTPSGVLFRIKKTVLVPSQGSVEVEAFADAAGISGEVGMTTFTIPGLLPGTREKFKAETVAPPTGGVKDVHAVTKSDVDSATQVLKDKLAGDLLGELRRQAKEGGFAGQGEISSDELLAASTDVPVGSEAPAFSLTVKMHSQAFFYDAAELNKLIEARLRENVPFDRKFVRVEEAATKLTIEKTDVAARSGNLRVAATGVAILSPDAPQLDPGKIAGVSSEAAVGYLEKLDGVSSASVKVSPFWSGRLPDIAENIKIEVR